MATRIYLPSSGSPAVTPSSWIFTTQIASPVTYAGVVNKISSAFTTVTGATGTTSPITKGACRYVIGPLPAGSISGTVKMVIRVKESNGGANANLAMAVKIIQPNGSDRATLLAVTSSDAASSPYEMTTTLASKLCYTSAEAEPLTLTSQTATAGDYLVIEIGFRSATTVTRNIDFRIGDNSSSDLTYGYDETNDYCGWVEFSQTMTFSQTVNETSSMAKYKGITAGDQVSEQDAVTQTRNAGIGAGSQINVIDATTAARYAGIGSVDQVNVLDGAAQAKFTGVGAVGTLTVEETLYGT